MYKFINLATERPEPVMQDYLDKLFGTPTWRDIRGDKDPDKRQDFLVNLYKTQLHDQARLNYIRTFEMIDGGNRTEYVLFFGTNSPKGLSEMKRSMWRADPEGGETFSDRTDTSQMVLIERSPDLKRLQRMLYEKFRDRGRVGIKAVEDFVLFDTPFSEQSHLKNLTLKPMEVGKRLNVVRPSGSPDRIGTYPPGKFITFFKQ